MTKKKSVLSLILAFCLCLALAVPALAAEDNVDSKTITPILKDGVITISLSNNDFTDNLVQVHGQIEFDESDTIMPLSDSTELDYITAEELEDVLKPYLEAGKTVKAVGWTKAYNKETSEVMPLAVGGEESYYGLTLYTVVSVDNFDRTRITADTVAVWNDKSGYGSSYNTHTSTRDAIGMTSPDGCLFIQYSLLGTSKNPHSVKGSDTSIAVEMNERNGKTTLMTTYTNLSCTGQHNWFSSYTHTWANTLDFDFSFSVSVTGKGVEIIPHISRGDVKYWTLASWVTCSL